ncbi:tyrosine-protein phosphatase 99A isoform X6 [Drosophila pseudoobscura]|uniref:Tyrosine-protein phosphatase 99A isoform X6 n=1 Tax=Drosophila pseudoobscura pseudoobscura TaxID=46245 RepID=A0A6I8VPF2_DROPS|nr:tyrosine-protein phosphatase 99A isoform X6 [Drosophila pseudoobscura]
MSGGAEKRRGSDGRGNASSPMLAPTTSSQRLLRRKSQCGNWFTRKCFHAAYYYLDDPPHHPNAPQVDWEVPVKIGDEIRAAVPVNEFAKHVASLHADGDIGFSREYEAIQNECISDDLPCEHSHHPENKRKNRYLNITAYDHSRVHLHPTPGQKKNLDYINANFIDGYQKAHAFIGTQGPLPDTFDCFWRMIWEQRVAIIVMITNLVERGRRKCDMYWPKDGVETYGVIQVKLIEEEVMSTYTVRTLQIKHLKLKKKKQCNTEKLVYQYHYTNWPDHGTPDHPLPVLNFVKKSSAANPAEAGPIVVHCSAGVGRTGTYIVLDAMLKQIQQKSIVNVFGFLRHIRAQRNFLVQTEEQYIFLHDALVEAIASGETNLASDQVEELRNCTPYLEQQYKNIIQFQPKDIHIASAMKQVNSIKNRGAIFPIEGSRVHLTPKPGEDGSDYINASWLHGFRRLRDFIVTQHPMAHTIKDFWQMVWDHNAQTVVLLSSLDDINFAQFWPDEATPIESDHYRVKYLNKTNKSDYVTRDFVIQSIQDDYELTVKMLHCPSWPEMSNPNSIYDFIVDVHERCNDYRNGPIVIVDRYGGAQACTFCAISSLAIEMEYCSTANVYQYAKLYHNKRPGVWTSSEDIRVIYNILSFLPGNLNLLKRTALRTEFEDVTTATPDLYSKICSNGNVPQHIILQQQQLLQQQQYQQHQQQQQLQLQLQQQQPLALAQAQPQPQPQTQIQTTRSHSELNETASNTPSNTNPSLLPISSLLPPTVVPTSNTSTPTPQPAPPISPSPSPPTVQLKLQSPPSPSQRDMPSPSGTATTGTATPTPTSTSTPTPNIIPTASPTNLTHTNANFHTVTNNAAHLVNNELTPMLDDLNFEQHQQQQMLALMQQQTQLQQQYNMHHHNHNANAVAGELLTPTTTPDSTTTTTTNATTMNNNVTTAAATDAQNLDIVG